MNSEEPATQKNARVIRSQRKLTKSLDGEYVEKNKGEETDLNPEYRDSVETSIIKSLESLDYDLSDYSLLNLKFDELVRGHIRFICGQPHGQSMTGANLISNGMFHYLWAGVLRRQNSVNFGVLGRQYFENYRHAILENAKYFQLAFAGPFAPQQPQHSELQDCDRISQENAISNQTAFSQEALVVEEAIVGENNPTQQTENYELKRVSSQSILPLDQEQADINQLEAIDDADSQEYDQNSLSLGSFWNEELTNERRIYAEMVCIFFGIPEEKVVSMKEIEVREVIEKYNESKFQILIARGQVRGQEGEVTCISCYKFHNLEQLARIEKCFGRVEIFLTQEELV